MWMKEANENSCCTRWRYLGLAVSLQAWSDAPVAVAWDLLPCWLAEVSVLCCLLLLVVVVWVLQLVVVLVAACGLRLHVAGHVVCRQEINWDCISFQVCWRATANHHQIPITLCKLQRVERKEERVQQPTIIYSKPAEACSADNCKKAPKCALVVACSWLTERHIPAYLGANSEI